MFRIQGIPPGIVPFFENLKSHFHWEHFEYLRSLVFAMAIAYGRRNVTNLYRHFDPKVYPHRTRFNNFFLVDRWEPEVALQQKAEELLSLAGVKPGDTIYLVLDSSKQGKRGKKMDAVSKLWDSTKKCYVMGHEYVAGVLRYRNFTIPWGIRLYVKKADCRALGLEFKKTTEMAAELIRELDLPDGVKVVVLFDTFFLCPVVVRACKEKGFHFVSTLKSNRNVFKNGRKLKAGAYARTCFQNRGSQRLTVAKANGTTSFQFVDVGWVDVSGAGRVHLVYSRKGRSKKALGIVTDDPSLSASEILQVYGERWPIEVFFKDSKQLLGLGQYQNVPYRAAVIHLHLVCFAYALLTHLAIQREGEKGTRKRDKAARLSTGDLQNELRWLAWEDLVDCLETLETGHDVIQELRRLLGAA